MEQINKSEIIDRVIELRNSKMSVLSVSKQLSREFDRDVPVDLIREIYQDIKSAKNTVKNTARELTQNTKELEKKDGGLKDFVKGAVDSKPYEYSPDTDHYVFKVGTRVYPLLRTTVLAMFEAFSTKGRNLTGAEMLSEFKMTDDVWQVIKKATGLYKQSIPFDPVTISMMGGSEEMEMNAEQKAIVLKEADMRRIYDRAVLNKMKSDNNKFAKTNNGYDLFITKLEEVLKTYKPMDFDKIKIPEIKNDDTKDVFLTDAHLGKKGTDGIVIRFQKLTRDILESPEKNINITFGGDIGECFLPYGEMHVGQKLGMEDIGTEDLVMLAIDVFQNMLVTLYKAGKHVIFNGMGGNHDRFTDKKEFDPFRSPAMIIYRFLKKLVEQTDIEINILREKANVIKSGKVKYVFIHGDGTSEAELKRRALNDIEDGFYLCYVTGDKHHFRMHELSDRVMWIQSPSLAGQGQYDKSLGMTSQSGAIFFEKNKDDMLEFTLKRYL